MDYDNVNGIQRLLQRIAATPFGGWVVLNILTPLDQRLLPASKGRLSLTTLAGVPAILLTTTGAKTGERRTIPLLCVRDGKNIVLMASATGIKNHPAWYHNLRKNPQADVLGRHISGTYTAREAEGEERDRLWARAVAMYPGYDVYKERASHRRIPVMVLEPMES